MTSCKQKIRRTVVCRLTKNLPEMTNRQNSDGAGVIFRFGKVRLGRVILQRVILRQRVLLRS